MRRLKSLRLYAKVLFNARSWMKSMRVYAKFSPNARYEFKSWRKLSKMARNDSTSIVTNSGPSDLSSPSLNSLQAPSRSQSWRAVAFSAGGDGGRKTPEHLAH